MRWRTHVAFVVAAYGVAAHGQEPVTLWRDIQVGMSAAKVWELYPEQKGAVHHKPKLTLIEGVQEVGRCHPDVHVDHPNGVVDKVIIYSRYRGFPKETCGGEAYKALLGKYGSPHGDDEAGRPTGGVVSSGLFRGLDTRRIQRDTKQTWVSNGVLITFERWDAGGNDRWFITYEASRDIGL
ncbi:hypothetical protein [Caenibius sp. WL]|uniref:hypothetical protein n=1 Tax=Caenibius sp. WL TaxID=2872646 RepID=UPI001C99EC64|nr:hypothetical protein [Caenibius sp. WL]QZP06824.1 hypothetical protein K5X80_08790 [Caenibius sp. WL]